MCYLLSISGNFSIIIIIIFIDFCRLFERKMMCNDFIVFINLLFVYSHFLVYNLKFLLGLSFLNLNLMFCIFRTSQFFLNFIIYFTSHFYCI